MEHGYVGSPTCTVYVKAIGEGYVGSSNIQRGYQGSNMLVPCSATHSEAIKGYEETHSGRVHGHIHPRQQKSKSYTCSSMGF